MVKLYYNVKNKIGNKNFSGQAFNLHKINTFSPLKVLFLGNSQTFKNCVCRSQLAYLSCIHANLCMVWYAFSSLFDLLITKLKKCISKRFPIHDILHVRVFFP